MEDYIVALRSRDNTPAPLLNMDREHEQEMLDNFKSEVEAKRKDDAVKPLDPVLEDTTTTLMDKVQVI